MQTIVAQVVIIVHIIITSELRTSDWHSAPFPTHTQLTSTHNFGPGLVRCEIILSLQLFHQAVIKCSTNPSGQATSGWPLI